MILFWKKLRCNLNCKTFLGKRRRNSSLASYIMLGMMLVLGNSCDDEVTCSKPTGNLGTITLTIPKIAVSTAACGYDPRRLQDERDLAREFTDSGWLPKITIGGSCTQGLWAEPYLKNDFQFSKLSDGSMEFVIPNVPFNEPLSLRFDLFSNCIDNALGQCTDAGVNDYRAWLTGSLKAFTPKTSSRHYTLLDNLDENNVKWGPNSGCQ